MEKAKKEYNKKTDILKQKVNLRNEFRQAAYGCGIKNSSEEELKPAVILKSIDSFKQQ